MSASNLTHDRNEYKSIELIDISNFGSNLENNTTGILTHLKDYFSKQGTTFTFMQLESLIENLEINRFNHEDEK